MRVSIGFAPFRRAERSAGRVGPVNAAMRQKTFTTALLNGVPRALWLLSHGFDASEEKRKGRSTIQGGCSASWNVGPFPHAPGLIEGACGMADPATAG
jgi:hypothetical protein